MRSLDTPGFGGRSAVCNVADAAGCGRGYLLRGLSRGRRRWAEGCYGRARRVTAARKCAGQWRGLDVAIKTVIFSSSQGDQQTQVVASEAAIASNLSHKNIVATYNHDILDVAKAVGPELGVYKFYLIQARPPLSSR